MTQVIVRDNFESALRIFKGRVDRAGILREVKSRLRDDPKPSVKRKEKARIAEKRKRLAEKRWSHRRGIRIHSGEA